MSRPGRPPRSQQRPLSPEDEALWSTVASSMKPARKKPRVHPFEDLLAEARELSERLASRIDRPEPRSADQQPIKRPAVSPARVERTPPPLSEFDRRQLKQIARGRKEIEARIDLHGMRANEAHAALRAFIFGCYARGQRNLLVITGKGGPRTADERPFELWDQSDRGVLKRSVPLWLAESDLRSVVISFTEAHPRHGGGGALYVQLRRRKDNRER